MAVSTTNITTTAVGNALGVTTRKVTELCKSPKVNPWAKYKPISMSFTTRPSGWWKGSDSNCGWSIRDYGSYRDMPQAYTGGNNSWTPVGLKAGDACRLADFGGYEHSSEAPALGFTASTTEASATTNYVKYTITLLGGNRVNNLWIQDFRDFRTAYFGVVAISSKATIRATSTVNMSTAGGLEVDLKYINAPQGNYRVYPFICSKPLTLELADVADTYYSFPGVNPVDLIKLDSYLDAELTGSISAGQCTVNLTIWNSSASTIKLVGGSVFFRYTSNDFDDPIQIGETKNLLVGNVPANGRLDYPTIRADVSDIISANGRVNVWLYLDSGKIKEVTTIYP